MYDTVDEAKQKLVNTVVIFDGTPTHIVDARQQDGEIILYHTVLKKKSQGYITNTISDERFDFRTIGSKLGYVNYENGGYNESVFVERTPVRKAFATQGLSKVNTNISNLSGNKRKGLPSIKCSWDYLHKVSGFISTVERVFPSLQEITEIFKEEDVVSRAFSPSFAVRRDEVGPFYLMYKGRDIGYTEDFERFKISNRFKYLEESLEEFNLKVV